MVKDNTLYDRLEVNTNASHDEIKKSYFKLSKKWHPDKHIDEQEKLEATQKFKELSEAKEILLDEEKRNLYNQIGMDILNNGGQMQNDFNPFGEGGFPFDNIFNSHFNFNMGNMGNMGNNRREEKPENIIETINVTLEDIYNEKTVDFTYKQKVYCSKCNGEGYKDGKSPICRECNGKGMKVQIIRMGNMIQQLSNTCGNCRGTGKVSSDEDKCDICVGNCYTIKDKQISIPLKSGLSNENKINISGKGHQLKNGKTDLIININEIHHSIFKRNGNDLFITLEIRLYQALFGFSKIINHLDNRELLINSNTKTDFNTIRKISNEGFKSLNSNDTGDLYVKFIINLPNLIDLPDEGKNNLKSILALFDKDEVDIENNINNKENLTKVNLCQCNQNIFDSIKQDKSSDEEDNQHHHHHQHQNPQNAQCVHQ